MHNDDEIGGDDDDVDRWWVTDLGPGGAAAVLDIIERACAARAAVDRARSRAAAKRAGDGSAEAKLIA